MTIDEVLKNTDLSNESVSSLKHSRDEEKIEHMYYMLMSQAYSHAIEQLALCGMISKEAQKVIHDMVNNETDIIRENLIK